MAKSVLDKIEKQVVRTSKENLNIYRLGNFEKNMYELVEFQKNQYYPPHSHKNSRSKLFVIFGEGKIILGNNKHNYKKGDIFHVRKGMPHGFRCRKETLILSIQQPPIINQKTGKVDLEYI